MLEVFNFSIRFNFTKLKRMEKLNLHSILDEKKFISAF